MRRHGILSRRAAMERAMKVQDVILQAMAKKITWWQAAEIIGHQRPTHAALAGALRGSSGYNGLFDRRRGKPSHRKVPVAAVEKVLGLYREKYFDLNVQHFHEKLQAEHEHRVELHLGEAGAAGGGAGGARDGNAACIANGVERRPLPGMLLHIDGSRHQWFQDERWYDLIVILDDATSEIYYAQLVEEEATMPVMAGLKEVIERKGVFCALYSDRASHFWLTAKAGEAVDYRPSHAGGTGVARVGSAHDSGLLAASAGPQRTQLRYLAGPTAAGITACAGIRTVEAANAFLGTALHGEFNRRFQVASRHSPAMLLCPTGGRDLERIFSLQFERSVNRDNTVSFQNLSLQIEPRALASEPWRAAPVVARQHLDGTLSLTYGPHCLGRYDERGGPIHRDVQLAAARKAVGKDAPWKSPTTDFPSALGNPAKCAGFPLSHRLGGDGRLTKTGHFIATKSGRFNLLPTEHIFAKHRGSPATDDQEGEQCQRRNK